MLRVGGPRPADQMFLPSYYIWIPQASDFTLLFENRPPEVVLLAANTLLAAHTAHPAAAPLLPGVTSILPGSEGLHSPITHCLIVTRFP